jgi:hypothetical protein
MNQEFSYSNSYSTLTAMDGINGATVLKFYSKRGRDIFYVQTSGNEDQFQLSVYRLTGTPVLSIPAITFTSDKFALDLTPQATGLYVLHQSGPLS